MAGKNPRYVEGPITYPIDPSVVGGIAGGQLVQPHAGGLSAAGDPPTVEPGAAASVTILGWAENDALPAGTGSATSTAVAPPWCTVHHGIVGPVTFAAAATAGQRLQAAAAGQVTPITVATADPRTVVGTCMDESVGAAAVGLAFISPVGTVL